jgi:cyanophycinase-like exopeptidase
VGLICLQGGNEFAPECRDMDALLLDRAGNGPVVVVPLAGAPGREYDTAGANGVRHFRGLGATDVTVAPDARSDPAGAVEAIANAALLVIPGGSPRRLLDAARDTEVGQAIREAAAADDRVVTGSSAGAMVLCGTTLLPESRPPRTAAALDVVHDFVVIPHFDGRNDRWESALAGTGTDILGIPECSGVLLDGETVSATGRRPSTLIGADGTRALLALA